MGLKFVDSGFPLEAGELNKMVAQILSYGYQRGISNKYGIQGY